MTDPYKILGISRDATDDEVKNAYRKLARKYHPDNFASDETARSMAEEKMKDINEAYDAIQNSRKGGGGSSYDSGYNRNTYMTIRSYINSGKLNEAENLLCGIDRNDRGAEWHFLTGCIAASRGRYFDAQENITKACNMDPSNMEYQNALNNLRGGARGFNTGGYNTTQTQGCSGCDMCSSLLCADCLCECCGGDLISCC